jgi:hypothetical protein
VCGESEGINEDITEHWKESLPSPAQGHEPNNILNVHETG